MSTATGEAAAGVPGGHWPLRPRAEAAAVQRGLIQSLLDTAVSGLPAMLDAESGDFVHCLRRGPAGGAAAEGVNPRYSAIVLLGARYLPEAEQRRVLGNLCADEFLERALAAKPARRNLGDRALLAWAAAEAGRDDADAALARAAAIAGEQRAAFTVETAWLLSAASALGCAGTAQDARTALLASLRDGASIFPHRVGRGATRGLRGHVGCFADQVYPIQALARCHARFGDAEALDAAERCASRICQLQGEAGQWWWHYDARTSGLIEGYPVYSVHQDSMAPMALLDLHEAGGADHWSSIARGLDWLRRAPELSGARETLLDGDEGVIWRKVARRGPPKAARTLRALATRVRPGARLMSLERWLPPGPIDWESRPYHLGWILFAWLRRATV